MTQARLTIFRTPVLAALMPITLTLAVLAGCTSSSPRTRGSEYPLRTSDVSTSGALHDQNSIDGDVATGAASAELPIEIESWRFGAFAGQVIETPHYQIHTTIDRDWAREELPRFCEAAMMRYTTALGNLPKPARKLESYMFATREQWQAKAADLLPGQGAAYQNLGRGGLSTGGVAVLYYIDYYDRPRDTFAIAAHEGWHQYTQTTFKHQLPVWIEEGIAAYMEGFRVEDDGTFVFEPARNYERRRTLRRAVMQEQCIALQQLVNRSPAAFLQSGKENLLIYYAQGWAMCRFLVEGENGRYSESFTRLLRDAANGRLIGELLEFSPRSVSLRRASLAASGSGDTVIKVYFNPDVNEFESQYQAFVQKILDEPLLIGPRGRRRQSDGP